MYPERSVARKGGRVEFFDESFKVGILISGQVGHFVVYNRPPCDTTSHQN